MIKKRVPIGVKVLGILYYIGAVTSLLVALLMFIGASMASGLFSTLGTGGVLIGIGIAFLVIAVLEFFLARGLFKLQKWARGILIILAVLSVIGSLFAIIAGQFINFGSLIISGVIGGYLWFSKKVKVAFK